MVNNSEADYLLDGQENYQGFLEEFSNLIVIGTEGYHKLNFFLKKRIIQFSVYSYLNVFNSSIWLLTLISILFISGIISLNVSKQSEQKKSFWNIHLNLIFDYVNMLVSKAPSSLLTKLTTRHYLMYLIPIFGIILSNVITSEIFSNIITPQKQWCESLDCFAKSNTIFFTTWPETVYINTLGNHTNQWQFKAIDSRVKLLGLFFASRNINVLISVPIKFYYYIDYYIDCYIDYYIYCYICCYIYIGKFNLNDYLNIIRGKTVLITRDLQANIFLHYRQLADREVQNDWLIPLKMDFMIRLNLINKNHPNQKQIAKIIENSLHEYGIKVKIDRLAKHG